MKPFHFKFIALIVLFVACLSGCKKSSSNPDSPVSLSISSLSINSGPYNTTIIITGTGFNTTAAADQVTFNGKAAEIKSATSTQITTIVPKGAGTGNVNVTVNNITAKGPVFTYMLSATVSTLAGNDKSTSIDGTGTGASFNDPYAITTDKNGNVYVVDMGSNTVRKITPTGVVTTLAGSGKAGLANGTGAQASFDGLNGIVADVAGNLYVADGNNRLLRKITSDGVVTTFAGNSSIVKSADGTGTSASFLGLDGITIDAAGNLYVIDGGVRKITPAAVVTTVPGAQAGESTGLVVDANGNIFMSGGDTYTVFKLTNGVQSSFAGSGKSGANNGTGTAASFTFITDIAIDQSGNLLVTDDSNAQIRMISPAGAVSTIAGKLHGGAPTADGPGDTATFYSPSGIAVDPSGIIYICEANNNKVRKIVLE